MGTRKKEALEQFNKDNILAAARELFQSKGVENTTMDEIASLADYSKSTIYVYFRSKSDVYNAIVSDYMSLLIGELDMCINANKTFEDSYYMLCDCLTAFEEKYPQYYASLLGANNLTNSRKKSGGVTTTINKELSDLISQLLSKGIKDKAVSKDIEIEPTIIYIWSAISGIIQFASRGKSDIEERLGMTKEEYLHYSFKTFYNSLVRR